MTIPNSTKHRATINGVSNLRQLCDDMRRECDDTQNGVFITLSAIVTEIDHIRRVCRTDEVA